LASNVGFNAGVFVANLPLWRAQNMTSKLVALMAANAAALRNGGSGIWATGRATSQIPMLILFGHSFRHLPSRWNAMFELKGVATEHANRASKTESKLPSTKGSDQGSCIFHFKGPTRDPNHRILV
jgi:lipopolysaccharide biosynthesis glycosyltransferase